MRDDGIPIIGVVKPAEQPLIEVCRSYSRKLNLQAYGGNAYESADFFASRKMECAYEDRAWVSQQIYEECVEEVQESMRLFVEEIRARRGMKTADQQRRAG